jgi:hypothetical protein
MADVIGALKGGLVAVEAARQEGGERVRIPEAVAVEPLTTAELVQYVIEAAEFGSGGWDNHCMRRALATIRQAQDELVKLQAYVAGRAEFARKRGGNDFANLHALLNMIDKKALSAWLAVERMTAEERERIAREVEAELDAPSPKATEVPAVSTATAPAQTSLETSDVSRPLQDRT